MPAAPPAPSAAASNPSVHARLGNPNDWIDQHGDALLRFALVRVGDISSAEDLVQETLLAAWRSRTAYAGDCEPRTWLVSILKRRVADHFRRRGRATPCESGVDPQELVDAGMPPVAETKEFWRVLSSCTGDLPAHLARAFQLRTFGEADPAAICDAEGITRKNLSVRLHRARHLLRQCLETRWFSGEVANSK